MRSPFEISKLAPLNSRELHVLQAYKDPDFLNDLARLHNYIQYPHLLEELEKQGIKIKKSQKTKEIEMSDVADKYYMGIPDVLQFLSGFYLLLGVKRGLPFELENDLDYNFTVRFNADITKEDFDQLWQLVYGFKLEKHGGKAPKNRLPDEPELLYAIFKQRQKDPRPSFAEIFVNYQNGDLPGFNKHTNLFSDEDSLERYYNKYKPSLPDNHAMPDLEI